MKNIGVEHGSDKIFVSSVYEPLTNENGKAGEEARTTTRWKICENNLQNRLPEAMKCLPKTVISNKRFSPA